MPTARLELSIEVGSDPIQGFVIADDRAPQPFCGWIELTGAIEAARGGGAGTESKHGQADKEGVADAG